MNAEDLELLKKVNANFEDFQDDFYKNLKELSTDDLLFLYKRQWSVRNKQKLKVNKRIVEATPTPPSKRK